MFKFPRPLVLFWALVAGSDAVMATILFSRHEWAWALNFVSKSAGWGLLAWRELHRERT